jgi:hypothetical protein
MKASAKIFISLSLRISSVALTSNIIGIKLEDENGYLVWKVEMIDLNGHETELMIDCCRKRPIVSS